MLLDGVHVVLSCDKCGMTVLRLTACAVRRQLSNASTAVESINDRISVIVQYLQRVKEGVLSLVRGMVQCV